MQAIIRSIKSQAASLVCVVFFAAFCNVVSAQVRINQIQVIGTHNSYHIAQPKPVLAEIAKNSKRLAESLDYSHRPLAEQFTELGIRKIELDIFADPKGGLYAKPAGLKTPGAIANEDPTDAMRKPGFKILHVQDIDYRTTMLTLVDGLKEVRDWLEANPKSVPIMVMLELKESSIGPIYTKPISFTASLLDAIDREILSVFKPEQIIKPDDVRRGKETLREAVLSDGWPTLEESRGKVIFAMDNGGKLRDAYLEGHPSLRERILFVSVDEEHPAAAFMKINNPIGDFERIQSMVQKGFLVRTRADSGTTQSRKNDPTQRDKALASGAQYVSTDYPEPDARFSEYKVRLPNNEVARANPIFAAVLGEGEFDLAATGEGWSPKMLPLSKEKMLTRIAFGSCAKQDRPQPIWNSIIDTKPDLFLFIGDNIYGDSKDIAVLRERYGMLGQQSGYRKLAQTCPILATWDDHDYGANDAGVEFPIKRESQQLFLDFYGVAKNDPRRKRDGVYSQAIVGPEGKRVQIILLDTRFFRSPLASKKNERSRAEGRRGNYVASEDVAATVLGDEQWKWLEDELRKPAEVRIVASSIQVMSNEHGWEKWGNFPLERKRLFATIRKAKANGVVLISGDRHLAEIARVDADAEIGVGYPIYEVTSSSLNSPSNNFTKSGARFVNEVNPYRVGLTYFETNFGIIDVDWSGETPSVLLQVRDESGGEVLQQPTDFSSR